jgi:hypothetical protein
MRVQHVTGSASPRQRKRHIGKKNSDSVSVAVTTKITRRVNDRR